MSKATIFDRVGGEPAFHALVEDFYRAVECDPLLRPHYPDDLTQGKRHLAQFLAQYFGGGPIYSQQRGHPRLRMRHAPFIITPDVALRWAQLMTAAVTAQGWPDDVAEQVLEYVVRAAPHMVNAAGAQ